MSSATQQPEDARLRRRAAGEVKSAVRGLRNNLAMLNRQVGLRLDLRDVDLDCLDLINNHGPISPTALARTAGLHPATLTGILDRLERGGWIIRERASADRRSVVVRTIPDRLGDLYRLLAGMNTSLDEICADYTLDQLRLISEFLRRTATAGLDSGRELQ
ncbi:MarR family transcriptional regulator [Nocardia sp. CDC160]|uniref:MarR family transcriptional regulator n=1 Tax=Nocardia sp. CDC160 TaxID=3112166 RepID=UPI002DB971C8|nr:MarR family transcriptional regulator [Nocardia sp. CDC160]MEC3914492.1 MarR family transcriptional regulator [Nocardia sp. CDC160]